MNISLEGKKALVCGASQGIGKSIAIEFAKMGASIIVVARNADNLRRVVNELPKNYNQDHQLIATDFSKTEESINRISAHIAEGNTYDILINNTGGPAHGQLQEASVDTLKIAFNMHIVMSQLLVQQLIPSMMEKHFGRIINIISVGAKQPIEGLGVSNTIRGSMASWAKTLSRELSPYGITVNNILPGYTKTNRLDHLIDINAKKFGISFEAAEQQLVSKTPVGRLGKPEEIAYVAGFLASEYASFINGINLPVDGGYLHCL